MGKGARLINTTSGPKVYNQSHMLPAASSGYSDALEAGEAAYNGVRSQLETKDHAPLQQAPTR